MTRPSAPDRRRHVERFLALQPALRRGFAPLPDELRERLGPVTLHQLEALHHLHGGGMTMSALASALRISDASATSLVDRLVRQSLAVRETDPSDRRVVRISASARAEELIRRAHRARCDAVTRLFATLDDERLTAFMDVLERLAEAVPDPEATPTAGAGAG